MARTLTILHLSDLHAKSDDRDQLAMRINALFEDISYLNISIDSVVITGDLAYSGKKEEYEIANELLLSPFSSRLYIPKKNIYIVPGNHDVDRSKIDLNKETCLLNTISSSIKAEDFINNKEHSHARFGGFNNFLCSYQKHSPQTYRTHKQKINGITVGFACLNSAWRYGAMDKVDLFITEKQVNDTISQLRDCHLTIALLHHPLHLLHESENLVISDMKQHFDIITTGHLHENNSVEEITPNSDNLYFTAPPICDCRERSGYIIYSIDYEAKTVRAMYRKFVRQGRRFDRDTDHARDGECEFKFNARDLVRFNQGLLCHTISDTKDKLKDQLKKNLTLLQQKEEPVFVPPSLCKVEDKRGEQRSIPFRNDLNAIADGFSIVYGPAEIGKSIMLQALAIDINDSSSLSGNTKIAFYIDLHRSHTSIEEEIQETVNLSIPDGFKEDDYDEIVLCIDGLNCRDDKEIMALHELYNCKPNYKIVCVVGHDLLFKSLIVSKDFADASFYKINPWGPSRIRHITKRFLEDKSVDVDAAFNFVSNAMRDTDLPSTPVFVLIYLVVFSKIGSKLTSLSFLHLLQEFERIRLSHLDNSSANSDYYKRKVLAMIAAKLAENDVDKLPVSDIEGIVASYFVDKNLDVNASNFINDIKNAGIIEINDGMLGFKYYVFYDYYLALAFDQSDLDPNNYTNNLYECISVAGALALYAGLRRENVDMANQVINVIEGSFEAAADFNLSDLDKYIQDLFLPADSNSKADDVVTSDINTKVDYEAMDEEYAEEKSSYPKRRESIRKYRNRTDDMQKLTFFILALKEFYNIFRNLEGIQGVDKVRLMDKILDYHIACNKLLLEFFFNLTDDANFQTIFAYLTTLGGQEFLSANIGNESLRLTIDKTLEECTNDLKKLLLLLLYADLRLPQYEKRLLEFADATKSQSAIEMIYIKLREIMIQHESKDIPTSLISAFQVTYEKRYQLTHGKASASKGALKKYFQSTLEDTKKAHLIQRTMDN